MYGEQPYGVVRTGQADLRAIFASKPEDAMVKSISIPAGFGVIPAGAVIGIITESTNRKGMYVPYTPAALAAALTEALGLAYLTADAVGSTFYVTMNDSYKFAVGDHVAIADSDTDGASAEDMGAITAIDRTTYSHIAAITVTNTISGAFTVANGAALYHQSKTTAPFLEAKGVLLGAVDTGVGEKAKGGAGVLVFGNAILYKGALHNYDANVKTDLGNTEDGNLVYLK